MKKFVKENLAELYVGTLLFVGIPAIGWLYGGFRMFLALTIVIQAMIGILYIYRSNDGHTE